MNNDHMREAKEGLAILEDVEEDTFVGFCEYAYTGDYVSRIIERTPDIEVNDAAPVESEEVRYAAAVEWAEEEEALAPPEPLAEEAPSDYWGFRGGKNAKTTKAEQLWSNFKNLEFKDKNPDISDEKSGMGNKDFTSAFPTAVSLLYHTKLYIFAEKYLVDNLRILCLRKLHANLRDFELTVHTSEDILEILEFAYKNTARQESGDNELRTLIVHYAACKAEVLKRNTNLRSLLEANGEMACDLFYKVLG